MDTAETTPVRRGDQEGDIGTGDRKRARSNGGKENNAINMPKTGEKSPMYNPYASHKKKPKPSSPDDVEVLTPPPAMNRLPRNSHAMEYVGNNNEEDDVVMEWSNATNANVEFPHRRPDCGVHDFLADPTLFCTKCFCVICDKPAKECTEWQSHCKEKRAPDNNNNNHNRNSNNRRAIDIETLPANFNPINPAVQSYYARNQALSSMRAEAGTWTDEEDDDGDDYHSFLARRLNGDLPGIDPNDHHFSKEFNHRYNNENGGAKKRNPRDQKITEILAEKMHEALQLAEKADSITNGGKPPAKSEKGTSSNDVPKSTLDQRRKKRFDQCNMEGDIAQLGLHKSFFVEGVRIGWPYPSILQPQRQMAIHLVKALKNSRHVVLESPTGTGKSAAILCSALAWQRYHVRSCWGKKSTTPETGYAGLVAKASGENEGENFPRIIYCSRTHSQVAQMVASLKKTPYRPRMAVLGSRDRLCIHRHIRNRNPNQEDERPNKSRVNANTACQIRVANTEKIRKRLWRSHDYRYYDEQPPLHLPGDGDGGGNAADDDDDGDEEITGNDDPTSGEWILRNSTKKLTCPHYRQLTTSRTAQMARANFMVTQEAISCCKVGGEKTKLGAHDIEDLVSFGVNPFKEKNIALYRRDGQGGFGIELDKKCQVLGIQKDSPAEFNGQLRKGDKIVSVNDTKVRNIKHLEDLLSNNKVEPMELTVLRRGALPDDDMEFEEKDVELYRRRGEKSYGMTLESSHKSRTPQVFVNEIQQSGAAATCGLKTGDIIIHVNRRSVEGKGIADVAGEISRTKFDPLRLRVRRTKNEEEDDDDDIYSPHAPCPYYISRQLAATTAELVFAPYQYVVDPSIRRALGIDLKDAVVVLDEAHNVETTLTESASLKLAEIELTKLLDILANLSSKAKCRDNSMEVGRETVDASEAAHELLLFVEKIVLYLREERVKFENAPGNVGAAHAIEQYKKWNTPDNTENEVKYYGPSGVGLNGECAGCKPFLDKLDMDASALAKLVEYAQALETHINGNDRNPADGSSKNRDDGTSSSFDLLSEMLGKFYMASETPEHFFVSCVVQANGNLQFSSGEEDDFGNSGGRFRKKPVANPFFYPRSEQNRNALLPVCGHKKCKQRHPGGEASLEASLGYSQGVRHGSWCHGGSTNRWEAHLHLKLLYPGLLLKDLTNECRSVVLASGSLSPVMSLCAELDLKGSETSKTGRLQMKPKPLEANHVVNLPKQLLSVAIGHFPDHSPLTVNYASYSRDKAFFARLGNAIATIVEGIPRGGVLVFFPSYSVLNKCVNCWKPFGRGRWDDENACPEVYERFLHSKGKVIVEPTGNQEAFEAARDEYAEAIRTQGRCLLLAVFRGRLSEGVSFNDDYARGVICVGIPFPAAKNRNIVAKQHYNNEQRKLRGRSDLLPGNDWYSQEAFRAIAQALGRVIRHVADYGTIVLLDSRHCNDGSPGFIHKKLPKWMRHSVRTLSMSSQGRGANPIIGGYRGLQKEMKTFFTQAPIYTQGVLEKRQREWEAAHKRENQSSGHSFDTTTGSWTPNTATIKPLRVTQESPVPPFAHSATMVQPKPQEEALPVKTEATKLSSQGSSTSSEIKPEM